MFVPGNNCTFCALLFAFLPHGTSRLHVSTHLASGVVKREIQELSKYRGKKLSSVFVPFSRIPRIKNRLVIAIKAYTPHMRHVCLSPRVLYPPYSLSGQLQTPAISTQVFFLFLFFVSLCQKPNAEMVPKIPSCHYMLLM